MIEFTGERLVPGQVDDDLFNEHIARYRFAARLARNKHVLDIACGVGYGSSALASAAASVYALDLSPAAVAAAREAYSRPNLHYVAAAAQRIPFPDRTFDLIVAFEVLEHLSDWPLLLAEARRLLAPGGQFIVSTPNKDYYADSRGPAGANPYHVHEFSYPEFRDALSEQFPSVSLFLQNHVQAVAFQPTASPAALAAELAPDRTSPTPELSHFFLAVCAASPQTGAPLYLYVPATSNLLREREQHIAKLEDELVQKNDWLDQSRRNLATLHALHQQQTDDLRKANAWGLSLDQELAEARHRVLELQDEVEAQRIAGEQVAAGYEAQIDTLQSELIRSAERAEQQQKDIAADLTAKLAELAACVELLHAAEATVEQRTTWALGLQARIEHLENLLRTAQGSRWLRLGRTLHVGPDLQNL